VDDRAPGFLGRRPGSGRVRIATEPFRSTVARDDVAAVLAAIVHEPRAAGRVLYAGAGDDPTEEALAAAPP
jgi:hypothetical protein